VLVWSVSKGVCTDENSQNIKCYTKLMVLRHSSQGCSEADQKTASGHYNPFPTFPFTGKLRPVYPLSPRRAVPESIPHPDYAKDGVPRSEQKFIGRHNITILDKNQQEGMRKVCRLAREVLDLAAREVKPGITTDFIDEVVHKACIERQVRLPLL
jgi:methionyl aminopeptidase